MESELIEHANVARNRAVKVGKVTELLVTLYGPGEALHALQTATEADWARWAQMAGTRPLSDRSRQLVREGLERMARPSESDPFDGL